MRRTVTSGIASALVVMLAAGCGIRSDLMRRSGGESPAPTADTAVVEFLRPSRVGGAVQASVFEVFDDHDALIGIVSYDTRVAQAFPPGEHLFMVIGENADFMKAELQAGKAYYALVSPRMGWWKARFSLEPLKGDRLDAKKIAEWDRGLDLVTSTEDAKAWAESNAASISAKRSAYLAKWKLKSSEAQERYTLRPTDGLGNAAITGVSAPRVAESGTPPP